MEGLSVGKSLAVTSQAGTPHTTFRLVIMTTMMAIPLISNMIAMIIKIPSEMDVVPHYILLTLLTLSDMEFVKNFTPPDFQVRNFTPGFSPNLNSFSKKKHKN